MNNKYFDLETNGLNPDKIWCGVVNNKVFDKDNTDLIGPALKGNPIGHNIIDFDLPVLKKLHDFNYDVNNVVDTLILSRLFKPDRKGHSLEWWGNYLNTPKLPDLDWNNYDPAMIDRCITDVQITKQVHNHLLSEAGSHDWSRAIWIEQHIAHYHQRQKKNGVQFNLKTAHKVADEIEARLKDIRFTIAALMPPVLTHNPSPSKPFVAAGGYSSIASNHYGKDVSQVTGPFTKINIFAPNINSDPQVKAFLKSINWVPDEWNYKTGANGKKTFPLIKTSPKLSKTSLRPLGKIGDMFILKGKLQHRLSLLRNKDGVKGMVYKVRDDGRIEAGGITMGTPTGRYIHSGVVNIPKPSKLYGGEIRGCFIAPEGSVLLGSDAKGLEARMEGHYTFPYDGGKYAAELIDGNIHEKNATLWNVKEEYAKNGKYCLTYGGQGPRLAATLHVSKALGYQYFDAFWSHTTALKSLKDDVSDALSKGYLIGIDGRKLFIRSEHSALNMLFQSAGSITVKLATILMNQRLDAAGLDWKQVLHIHDEVLIEIVNDPEQIKVASAIIEQCWIDAGKELNINVPILGDVKCGRNWTKCH